MSLFLGNLSPHIRQEELERVFRRFGRSNVQLKDGYGFVIYDFAANAERALRALRGKIICGEQISLDWSNKQPRPLQRFSRGTRFFEPYRGRNIREQDNGKRNRGSHDRRDFTMGSTRHPTNNHRGPHLGDACNKEVEYTRENINDLGEGKGPSLKEGMLDEGGASELNPVGNDRWGEPVCDSLDDIGVENETEFERYEPYRGYDRRDDNESHLPGSNASLGQVSSPEKGWREHSSDATLKHFDNPKSQPICYTCGLVGHKMRYCPRGDAPSREKFSRFDNRRDDEMNFRGGGERGLKRIRPTSWGRPNAGRDPMLSRHYVGDGKLFRFMKPRRLVRRKENCPESKENYRPKVRMESGGKKRSKQESGAPKKELRKRRRTKRSRSSSLHSDSTATSSRSHSQSSRSVSGISSHSHSRSVSSRSHSESSSSRSVSSYSKSRSSRSRSSLPRSMSLSVSLDRKLSSSPKNVHTNADVSTSAKDGLVHVSNPGSKHLLVANLENSELKGAMKDENASTSFKVDDDIYGEHLGDGDVAGNFSTIKIGYKVKDSCMGPPEKSYFTPDKSSENLGEGTNLRENLPENLNPQIPVGCQGSNSTRMLPQEMCTVLKHYGLAAPEESELGLSTEAYFGAARLWPWEMIYYRRLKKGPITTENYARRIEQNKEFGIVDKYIRSSSGWGECDRNDT